MRSGYMADYGGNKMKVLTQQDIVESWVSPVVRVETLREILQDLLNSIKERTADNRLPVEYRAGISLNQEMIKARFGLLFKDEKCGAR